MGWSQIQIPFLKPVVKTNTGLPGLRPITSTISQPYIVVPNTDLVRMWAPYPFPAANTPTFSTSTIGQPTFVTQVQMPAPNKYPFRTVTSGQPGIRPLPGTISQPTLIPPVTQPNYPYPFPDPTSGLPGIQAVTSTVSQPYLTVTNVQPSPIYPFPAPAIVPVAPTGFASWASSTISQPTLIPPVVQPSYPYPFPTATSGQPGISPLPGSISQPTLMPPNPQPSYPYPFPVNSSGQPGLKPLPGTISQPVTIPYPTQPSYPYPFPSPTAGLPGIQGVTSTIGQPGAAPQPSQPQASYPFPLPSTVPVAPTGFASWAASTISQPLIVIPSQTGQGFALLPFPAPTITSLIVGVIGQPIFRVQTQMPGSAKYPFPKPAAVVSSGDQYLTLLGVGG